VSLGSVVVEEEDLGVRVMECPAFSTHSTRSSSSLGTVSVPGPDLGPCPSPDGSFHFEESREYSDEEGEEGGVGEGYVFSDVIPITTAEMMICPGTGDGYIEDGGYSDDDGYRIPSSWTCAFDPSISGEGLGSVSAHSGESNPSPSTRQRDDGNGNVLDNPRFFIAREVQTNRTLYVEAH
jgi:hypothetical protein